MPIGVLLRGFIGDMMDFGDVILRTLFPSFMIIQACRPGCTGMGAIILEAKLLY